MKFLELVIIISFLATLASPFLFFYFTEGILITEVIPSDQAAIAMPKVGDHIEVYGPWVNERVHLILPDHNEIHPVRYIKNLKTGDEWGSRDYNRSLMEGVHHPERFAILDKGAPNQMARGTVVDAFPNPEDGDWHIHLILDQEYQHLTKLQQKPVFYIPVLVLFGLPTVSFAISCGIWVYRKLKKG